MPKGARKVLNIGAAIVSNDEASPTFRLMIPSGSQIGSCLRPQTKRTSTKSGQPDQAVEAANDYLSNTACPITDSISRFGARQWVGTR